MRWLASVAIVGLATALAAGGRSLLGLPDVELVFLVLLVLAAPALGRGPAVLGAGLSVAAYDFFFVAPHYDFRAADPRVLLTFASMLGVGVLVGRLVGQLRKHEQVASRAALLSAVSHDLRTPLATITGAATALRDERSLDEATRRELLEDVCDEAERLERLVETLLDMTRLRGGAGVVRREWVPCDEVVGAALARVEGRLVGRVVRTTVEPELPLVPCDPILLQQLLMNLIENAAKHTPATSALDIRAGLARAGAVRRDVVIEVADRGPGLPRGSRDQLFEPFARRAPAEVPGTGLGLAICRGIAQAHGGNLVAEGRPGGGSIFRLTIPVTEAPPAVALERRTA